jgi:hypothetical protein
MGNFVTWVAGLMGTRAQAARSGNERIYAATSLGAGSGSGTSASLRGKVLIYVALLTLYKKYSIMQMADIKRFSTLLGVNQYAKT